MDDLIELVFNGILNSRRVPKIIKYILIILVYGFLVGVGIVIGVNSEMLAGNIIAFALAFLFLLLGIRMLIKIYRSRW